jgi:putative transposase
MKNEIKKERATKMHNKEFLMEKIKQATDEHPFFGYRRIFAILRYKYQVKVRRNTVYALMKELGVQLPPTRSNKKLFSGVPMNLNVATDRSNALWGIDMTYIWCGEDGWAYFHGVIDHYDKTLLGYNFSRSCGALGGVMALAEAAFKRCVSNLELRSDNGCQYGAKIFRQEILRLGINHTRTMVNTPKGNAVIERFFRSLKQECVWQHSFKNFEEAKEAVDKWVRFYNEDRPHQTLNYATPAAFYESESLRNIA